MARDTKWKKTVIFALIILVFSLGTGMGDAYAKSKKKAKARTKKHHVVVSNTAQYSDIVIEARTGRILHASSASSRRHPASLTKMMTLYLTFQALEADKISINQRLNVSSHAAAQSPSKLGLKPGQTIRVQDAILGVVTESANDAAVVLAEALGGSEEGFASLMTRQARALGMKHTTFQNASGLPDPDQITTAYDMAILGHALIYHYPRYYSFFRENSFDYAGRTHDNHNHLMERYEGMDGIKTGYVRASGFNLVASAMHGNKRLIGVVFGGKSATSRDNQMAQLLDEAFESNPRQVQASYGEAQGDNDETPDGQYVALPSKVAAIYPSQEAPTFGKTYAESSQNTLRSGTWGIQVGAYNDVTSGQQTLAALNQTLKPALTGTQPMIQKVQMSDGNTVYRARFMGLEQASARSVCAYLVKHGQGCLVVAPEQTGS